MSNIGFDGITIKYSDDVCIVCCCDEGDYSYTFDIYHKDGCEYNYLVLEQAHARALEFLNG